MEGETQFRFPPPQFESGHQLPVTQMPAPRAEWWQYADIVVLVLLLAAGTWLIYRKRSRRGIVGLSIFSLFYFGFVRKGCICSIGSIQNVGLGLFDSHYAVALVALWFFLIPLGFALFSGRSFCAVACPHGALQDLILLRPIQVPNWLEQGLSLLPFVYLGAAVLFAATGSAFIICEYDPFVPIFRMNGRTVMVISGILLLLLGTVVGRPYCRFLCPYGALLKLGSVFSKWRVRVTPTVCTQCRLCENSCPFGVIQAPDLKTESAGSFDSSNVTELLNLKRRRLTLLMLALPLLIVVGALAGWRFSSVAARLHPAVRLAELYLLEQNLPAKTGVLAPDDFAVERARQAPESLLAEAGRVRSTFSPATSMFGAWLALVIGIKLISLSLQRGRKDYEPERGSCFACARCFLDCPNELVRRGLSPTDTQDVAPALPISSHGIPALAGPSGRLKGAVE